MVYIRFQAETGKRQTKAGQWLKKSSKISGVKMGISNLKKL